MAGTRKSSRKQAQDEGDKVDVEVDVEVDLGVDVVANSEIEKSNKTNKEENQDFDQVEENQIHDTNANVHANANANISSPISDTESSKQVDHDKVDNESDKTGNDENDVKEEKSIENKGLDSNNETDEQEEDTSSLHSRQEGSTTSKNDVDAVSSQDEQSCDDNTKVQLDEVVVSPMQEKEEVSDNESTEVDKDGPGETEEVDENEEIEDPEEVDETGEVDDTEEVTNSQEDAENEVGEEEEEAEEEEEEEEWDLKHVHTIEEIESEKVKCMTKKCPLIACTTYVSSLDSTDIWYSCLDCQEKDYGGWPTEIIEIPITFMTEKHREVMTEKCTGRYSPEMPNLPTSDPSKTPSPSTSDSTSDSNSDSTSPSPQPTTTNLDIVEKKPKAATKTISAVTPPPGQLQRTKSTTNTKGASSKSTKVTPIPSKPSNQALAVHKKWQDVAKALGGERIVVSKPAAKKLIFDLLKDSFVPMNITVIFKRLKGVVPSPVLKSSLDDMALDTFNPETQFADSDDEDEDNKASKKKRAKIGSSDDEFAGSLSIKAGRNTNTTLYYCDYSKLSNNGNGLLPDDRNTLLSDHQVAKAELEAQNASIKSMATETSKLLSEPTNEEATVSLEGSEECVQNLREEVEAAQELKNFEKHRIKIGKKVDVMTSQWRKRRRVCMDFLMAMEDNTDGTISVKKCLTGDGQIYIESDSVAIKGQKEYAINQKKRGLLGKRSRQGGMANNRQKFGKASISGVPPSASFIGVDMNARGFVERIYLNDEN